MSAYQIDYSDPLRPSFSIPAGGLNGPGGSAANSTLRLYGRGALEWGEAVDEDLLRLSENFASASPPSAAISGQIWVETKLYFHNSGTTSAGWYRWNFTTANWELLNGNGNVATVAPTTPTIGQYYYGTGTYDGQTITGLWGYYSLGRYEPAAWLPRSFTQRTGFNPVSSGVVPEQVVRIRDGNAAVWSVPTTTFVGENPPSAPQTGMFWYVPSIGVLRVYSADTAASGLARWHDILGPAIGGNAPAAHGPINMNSFKVTNLALATVGSDAANKTYVDSAVAGGVANYLPLSGGTISGNLTVTGSTTLNTLQVNGGANFSAGITSTGGVYSGQVNMSGNKIVNVATPTVAGDAANKAYVDTAVAGSVPDLSTKYDKVGGPISGNVSIAGTLTQTGTLFANSSIILSGGSSQVTLPNAPTAAAHAANKAYVDAAIAANSGTPTGAIVMWPVNSVPAGWVECEGQDLNRTGTYANLFAAIGTTYGAGSASTFRVPDFRGMFPRGWSNGAGTDPGRALGTVQQGQIEAHKHVALREAINNGAAGQWGSGTVGGLQGFRMNGVDNDNYDCFTNNGADIPSDGVNSGAANWNRVGLIGSETRPVNLSMRFIIKY